jgi:plastocyanin
MRHPFTFVFVSASLIAAGLAALVSPSRATEAGYTVARVGETGPAAGALYVRMDTSGEAVAATVSQKEKSFAPALLDVRRGQTIAILNDDDVIHNVYCRAGDFKYNSGPQQPGVRSTITFTATGTYEVRCAIHPKMLLTVRVRD